MKLSVKRLIITAATMAGLAALGTPVAAQASTSSAQPTIVSVQAAAARVPNVAVNGNDKSWTVTLSNGIVCSWVVGDYATTDYSASGEADIKCPYAYTITEKVDLDYAYSVNGANNLGRTTGWRTFNGAAGTYVGLSTTPGICWAAGAPIPYWTTYAWISIGGSPTYEAWSQPYKFFMPVQCH
jgi:hypothetical protein